MMDGVIVERLPVNRLLRRKVTLWFGMYVWQNIAEKHDTAFEDFGKLDQEDFIIEVMYYAIEYGAFKKRKPWQRLSMRNVRRAYNLMPQKQLQRIVENMFRSRIGGDSILGQLNENKKKQPPMK